MFYYFVLNKSASQDYMKSNQYCTCIKKKLNNVHSYTINLQSLEMEIQTVYVHNKYMYSYSIEYRTLKYIHIIIFISQDMTDNTKTKRIVCCSIFIVSSCTDEV